VFVMVFSSGSLRHVDVEALEPLRIFSLAVNWISLLGAVAVELFGVSVSPWISCAYKQRDIDT
jgi:hypothetical protein